MNGQDRGPAKRKVKPVDPTSLLDFDLGEGESSDDSDFRIEDHAEESDDCSLNTDEENKRDASTSDSSDDDSDSEQESESKSSNRNGGDMSVAELLEKAQKQEFKFPTDIANILICSGCLGSKSDDLNEIVECDGCGVTVHEGCYGVSDVASESSTVSMASTEPWFCEACKAGVKDPTCELCPNKGGIFKETEVGAWVHLVCALYVPGVAFSEVERLSGVTLFEMSYSRWGARSCSLCPDASLARAGVCVGCDAGLCKTYFHVTCGQREGLLAEAHSEEAEQADPFYAHCRLHSDKTLIKRRKRSWLALQLRTAKRKMELQNNLSTEEKQRIQRKLVKYTRKYLQHKENRNPPWVPTQKMPRMLYSSASAMRKFQRKAECMGINTQTLEFQEAQIAALKDVSRRWHIAPAFSVEFVAYYLERNSRVSALRKSLESLTKENEELLAADEKLRQQYDEASKENAEKLSELESSRRSLQRLYAAVTAVCPRRAAPPIVAATAEPAAPLAHKRCSVPTAAALKMGVGFPLSDNPDARHGKVLSTSFEASASSASGGTCCVCGGAGGGVLTTCDTCRQHYHLRCLNPPLARPPKKSKLYGWQCSECDKTSESEPEILEKKGPRKSRVRYSKDGAIIGRDPISPPKDITPPKVKENHNHKIGKHEKINKITTPSENHITPPIKLTIKPFEFTSENESEVKIKKDKKNKRSKQREYTNGPEGSEHIKKLKRSFTSPALTNTPLMSITPIVADSPNDSHNENSNASTNIAPVKRDDGFTSQNLSFSSLLNEAKEKERDSKEIESSIEHTLANLSSDIATYKANRKRRKEKHRSRYSPELLRSPSKHKHKRKKKRQDMENPNPHPRITIKIKPIPKPDGSLAPQMFYVPTDSNDGPPPAAAHTIHKQLTEQITPPAAAQNHVSSADTTPRSRPSKGRGSAGAGAESRAMEPLTHCDVCAEAGTAANLVRCDECFKRYHFTCLEPPLNKNPKKRGYSWHCADCDPTDIENN